VVFKSCCVLKENLTCDLLSLTPSSQGEEQRAGIRRDKVCDHTITELSGVQGPLLTHAHFEISGAVWGVLKGWGQGARSVSWKDLAPSSTRKLPD
jgi:hypothetical protein